MLTIFCKLDPEIDSIEKENPFNYSGNWKKSENLWYMTPKFKENKT